MVTFPEISNSEEVQTLWRELLKINRWLSVRPCDLSECTSKEFEQKSRVCHYVIMFTNIYPAKHVTPYMHAMMMHVSHFMEIHEAILPFMQHGMEKYKDSMTKDYFRSFSHYGQECLTEILQKQNHLEHLEHTGRKQAKKFSVTCGNCGEQGHNKSTCTKPCKKCGHAPYCEHLVKEDTGSARILQCLDQ